MVDLGSLLQQEGRFDEAEEAYRSAIGSRHRDQAPRAMISMAVLLKKLGRLDEAENLYRQAIALGNPRYTRDRFAQPGAFVGGPRAQP